MDNGPEGAWISADEAKRGNSNRPSAAKIPSRTWRASCRRHWTVLRARADLDGMERVGRVHLAEARSYRALADEARRAA